MTVRDERPDRPRPAAHMVCQCGHPMYHHPEPGGVTGQPWGPCNVVNPARCGCREGYPLTDQPLACAACFSEPAPGDIYCVGHQRLMRYDPSRDIAANN